MANFSNFHNLFSLSKTLRFRLKPIGKTQENFEKSIFAKDEKRAELFKNVKGYLDEYHKEYIEKSLKNINKEHFKELLKEYRTLITASYKKDDETFTRNQKKLRDLIESNFKNKEKLKASNIIEENKHFFVSKFGTNSKEVKEINYFEGFPSYFTRYDINRENIYSNKGIHTEEL